MFSKKTLVRGAALISVAAIAIGAATGASAADRRVRIVNETNHTLVHLYGAGRVYNTYTDWLGRYTLAPGASIVIDFNDGTGDCQMVLMGQFNDGDRVTNRSFNVCTETRLTYTGD